LIIIKYFNLALKLQHRKYITKIGRILKLKNPKNSFGFKLSETCALTEPYVVGVDGK
jgi:hypothetical protein